MVLFTIILHLFGSSASLFPSTIDSPLISQMLSLYLVGITGTDKGKPDYKAKSAQTSENKSEQSEVMYRSRLAFNLFPYPCRMCGTSRFNFLAVFIQLFFMRISLWFFRKKEAELGNDGAPLCPDKTKVKILFSKNSPFNPLPSVPQMTVALASCTSSSTGMVAQTTN